MCTCIKVTSEAAELSESALVDASLALRNMADYMRSLDTTNTTMSELEEQARFVIFYQIDLYNRFEASASKRGRDSQYFCSTFVFLFVFVFFFFFFLKARVTISKSSAGYYHTCILTCIVPLTTAL